MHRCDDGVSIDYQSVELHLVFVTIDHWNPRRKHSIDCFLIEVNSCYSPPFVSDKRISPIDRDWTQDLLVSPLVDGLWKNPDISLEIVQTRVATKIDTTSRDCFRCWCRRLWEKLDVRLHRSVVDEKCVPVEYNSCRSISIRLLLLVDESDRFVEDISSVYSEIESIDRRSHQDDIDKETIRFVRSIELSPSVKLTPA